MLLFWEIFNKKNLINKNEHYTCSLDSRTKFSLKACNVDPFENACFLERIYLTYFLVPRANIK